MGVAEYCGCCWILWVLLNIVGVAEYCGCWWILWVLMNIVGVDEYCGCCWIFKFSGTLRLVDVSDGPRTYVIAIRNYLATRKKNNHNLTYQKCLDYYVLHNMIRQMVSSRIIQAGNFSCTKSFRSRVELNSNWVRALSVPMHLGLKTGPMCLILWCQVMEALVLHSSSRLTLTLLT